ncbi:MAG: hypothetical protein LBJ67_12505 [Planctomycetaceae bacterium]|nr:hypothetical protein [Planctomycetaceae bacterium]
MRFPPPEREAHDANASNKGILSGEIVDTEYDVQIASLNIRSIKNRIPFQKILTMKFLMKIMIRWKKNITMMIFRFDLIFFSQTSKQQLILLIVLNWGAVICYLSECLWKCKIVENARHFQPARCVILPKTSRDRNLFHRLQ